MYYCFMETEDLVILIVVLGTLLFGAIIFVMSCVYYVKKDHVIIVEKMENYHGTYEHGFYWFWPFVYHRVGYYATKPIERKIRLSNGRKALINYQILKPKEFHYFHTTVESFINKMSLENVDMNFEAIKENFASIGIDFISIRAID